MSLLAPPARPVETIAIPAPAPPRSTIVGDWSRVFSATTFGQLTGLATGWLLRAALDPAAMGIWQSLKLTLSYSNYANLGASKGAAREWSIARGAGVTSPAQHQLHVAHTINTLASGAAALVALGIGASIALHAPAEAGTPVWSLAWFALAAWIMLHRRVTFEITLLRAEGRFDAVARLGMFEGLATLLLAGGGAWLAGLPGLLAGTLLVALGSLVYLGWSAPRGWRWTWDLPVARRLIGIGGPLLALGLVTTLFRSLDRLAILSFGSDGVTPLGHYSLALWVGHQLDALASLLALVLAPRLAATFGATGRPVAVARRTSEALLGQAWLLATAGGAAWVVAPALLASWFPAYRPGLEPLPWIIVGAIAWGLGQLGQAALLATRQERWALAALGGSTLATALALAAGHGAAPQLDRVAQISAAGGILYASLIVWQAVGRWSSRRAWRRELAALAGVVAPPVGVAACLEHWTPAGDLFGVALKLLVVLSLSGLIAGVMIARRPAFGAWTEMPA